MIEKIICPTNFSGAANNASEYAAKLAQDLNAELLFINVQRIVPVVAAVSMGEGIGAYARENSVKAAEKLRELCSEVNEAYHIAADYEINVTTSSLTKTILSVCEENAIIVMGTDGVDEMYEYFFGTNTYHVIKSANCPVLMIPENVFYMGINKIVFAWDYAPKNKLSFSLLNDLKKAFNPEFVFIHVSKNNTEVSRDVFKAYKSEIISALGKDSRVGFEQIFSNDISQSINDKMLRSEADILTVIFEKRGLIPDIFHGTITRELSQAANYPVLVLHT